MEAIAISLEVIAIRWRLSLLGGGCCNYSSLEFIFNLRFRAQSLPVRYVLVSQTEALVWAGVVAP